MGGGLHSLLRPLRLLQQLVGVQQHLGPKGLPGALPGVQLHAVGQRPCDEGGDEHDGEGHGVFRLVGMEAELGVDEEPIEQQDAEQRPHHAVDGADGDYGDDQNPQDEDGDDVGF